MQRYISDYINYHPVKTQRGLEILTGLIPWSLLVFLFFGSYLIPEIVAGSVILFNVYWLYRSTSMVVNAISGYLNIRATSRVSWPNKLRADKMTKGRWKDIYHAVLICNVKEPLPTMRRTLDALAAQDISNKQLIVVLAMEKREVEAKEKSKILMREYGDKFGAMITTYHDLKEGETIGKHSNEAFAAKQVKQIMANEKRIPVENILVTTADADSIFPTNYFSLLTYKYLTTIDAKYKFFQAPQFAYNNLHKVPFFIRIMEMPSGISQLSGLKKYSKRYFVVSTYSTSLWLLDKIGYWDLDAIPEDWHVNLKAFFSLGKKVEVLALFTIISIDAAQSSTVWKTWSNRYQQVKRQAWGITDVPYVVKQFFLHPEIPLFDRLSKVSFVFESHFFWSLNWFILTIGANLPTLLNSNFARTTFGYNLSKMSAFILTMCLTGLITIIFINILLDPNRKRKVLAFFHPLTYLEWIFLPIVGFFLNAVPGLESQTRLMLGKYIGYRVTEKV